MPTTIDCRHLHQENSMLKDEMKYFPTYERIFAQLALGTNKRETRNRDVVLLRNTESTFTFRFRKNTFYFRKQEGISELPQILHFYARKGLQKRPTKHIEKRRFSPTIS